MGLQRSIFILFSQYRSFGEPDVRLALRCAGLMSQTVASPLTHGQVHMAGPRGVAGRV